MNTLCYVYSHRRLDTNEVFYVGIGKTKNYQRAFTKHGRNSFWKRVVTKYGHSVEILFKNLSWEKACEKEIELITFYGRKNLNTGTLVNLTDGGDGAFGLVHSKERKLKMKASAIKRGITSENRLKMVEGMKGRKLSKEHCENMRKCRAGKPRPYSLMGGNNPRAIIVLHLETGIYYDCIKDAAEAYGISYHSLFGRKGKKPSYVFSFS